jgi:ribosomal protein S18 acetylase RimI-like enzyme
MTGMVSIRSATMEDASSISRVHLEGWRTTYRGIVPDAYLAGLNAEERTIRWREILSSARRVFVAEQNKEIVGFISGGAIREPLAGCDAELYSIYLLLPVRSQGIGTALLIELAKRLDEDGFESMAVWVLEANAATRFYEGSGAARVGAKEMEIEGARLAAAAYAWPSLKSLIASK